MNGVPTLCPATGSPEGGPGRCTRRCTTECAIRAGAEKAATVAASPTPYGCHNRPALGASRYVQDGYRRVAMSTMNGGCEGFNMPREVEVPHRMSTECQHPSAADPRCTGCKWRRT